MSIFNYSLWKAVMVREQSVSEYSLLTFTVLNQFLVAAACLVTFDVIGVYVCSCQASDDKRTQKDIGDIAGVADVTIRQSYKLMYPHAKELFPDDFKFSTPIELLPPL